MPERKSESTETKRESTETTESNGSSDGPPKGDVRKHSEHTVTENSKTIEHEESDAGDFGADASMPPGGTYS